MDARNTPERAQGMERQPTPSLTLLGTLDLTALAVASLAFRHDHISSPVEARRRKDTRTVWP